MVLRYSYKKEKVPFDTFSFDTFSGDQERIRMVVEAWAVLNNSRAFS